MFLLDAPYVSEFLKQTVRELGLPVLDTPQARRLAGDGLNYVDAIEFGARMGMGQRIYANSENGLEHVLRCGCHEDLGRQVNICKDKALFRETVAELHPGYRFFRVTPDELDAVDVSDVPFPVVVKPARGFFSLGVHVVNEPGQWEQAVQAIRDERETMNTEYPEEVVNSGEYIVEQAIPGDEYAIDVYYDDNGQPVITNILYHHFMGVDDVSDRLYYISAAIIETWLEPFTHYVTKMGRACGFRNFPVHLEVRVGDDGSINPIEANPLRFAGWCVADITTHAWGFNPYEYYFKGLKPDWPALLEERRDTACAMVIGDIASGTDRERITRVDYDGFCDLFDTVLELRKINYTEYPVFAFAFIQVELAKLDALKESLACDFGRFVEVG